MHGDIEDLIRIYKDSAKNLRNVADLAEQQDRQSVADTSRAKASTYDLVISDLEQILKERE